MFFVHCRFFCVHTLLLIYVYGADVDFACPVGSSNSAVRAITKPTQRLQSCDKCASLSAREYELDSCNLFWRFVCWALFTLKMYNRNVVSTRLHYNAQL